MIFIMPLRSGTFSCKKKTVERLRKTEKRRIENYKRKKKKNTLRFSIPRKEESNGGKNNNEL